MAFVQSPGGEEHDKDFPYANSVTSMVALKQAQYVCEDNEEGKAYVLYQHMRTPGLNENFYKSIQQDPGIFLTKGEVMSVSKNGNGLVVEADNTLLGDKIKVKADLVVLGTGMIPATKDDPIINLAYRQGPALSDLDLFDGYADSHFICFPYETRRTGVYTCGGVRKAETMEETIDDATGAALKAIREYMRPELQLYNDQGFFLISKAGVSLASMRDNNIGTRNLISKQYPELLQRAFLGEVVFVPPLTSDVDLGLLSKSGKAGKPLTLNVVAGTVVRTGSRCSKNTV